MLGQDDHTEALQAYQTWVLVIFDQDPLHDHESSAFDDGAVAAAAALASAHLDQECMVFEDFHN